MCSAPPTCALKKDTTVTFRRILALFSFFVFEKVADVHRRKEGSSGSCRGKGASVNVDI
jgi:hypothetical protein